MFVEQHCSVNSKGLKWWNLVSVFQGCVFGMGKDNGAWDLLGAYCVLRSVASC